MTSTNRSNDATSWKTKSNAIYYDGNTDRYIRYNSGWSSLNSGSGTVYAYQKQTVNFKATTTVSGTYSIAGNPEEIRKIVKEGTTIEAVTLNSTLMFAPTSGNPTTTENPTGVKYTVVEGGDPNGVISGISGNSVNLTGKLGRALVKVSYESSFGTVSNYIEIYVSAPYYKIELHKNDNNTLGEQITKPVPLKNVKAGNTYSVWAVVKEYDGVVENGEDGEDIGRLGDRLQWSVSDEGIATIDKDTGIITFTGEKFGTFRVTVAFEGLDGELITDTIIISATDSPNIVPGDGTDDFPVYPAEGSVRFDKTATAVGNYSETGIAKVELSMTGVPNSTSSRMDVVLMLDRSSSMNKTGVKHRISS